MEPSIATGVATPQPVTSPVDNLPVALASFGSQALALADAAARTSDESPQYGPLVGVVQV